MNVIWNKTLEPILKISWSLRQGLVTFLSRRATQLALLVAFVVGAALLLVIGLPLALLLATVFVVIFALTWVVQLLVGAWRFVQLHVLRGEPDPNPFNVANPTPFPTLEPSIGGFDLVRTVGPYNPDGFYDGVFEGGGVKAIAQIGALRRMEEFGMRPQRLVGTSGGAIAAAGIAVGGTSADLWNVLARADLTALFDARNLPNARSWRRPFYGITPLMVPLVQRWGLMKGDAFLTFMRSGLRSIDGPFEGLGRDITFGDIDAEWRKRLKEQGLPDPAANAHRLTVLATDVTRGRPLRLPDDISQYCLNPGGLCATCRAGGDCVTAATLDVARAVRMSMSIPFLFEPYRLRLKLVEEGDGERTVTDGGLCHIVDGGVSSNFPIWILDTTPGTAPRYPTFGFLLDEDKGVDGRPLAEKVKPVRWLGGLAMAIIGAGIGVIDRVPSKHNARRTVSIPTLGVGTADFELTAKTQVALHESGVRAADRFFTGADGYEPFDWAEYVRSYRGGKARPVYPGTELNRTEQHKQVEYVKF